MQIENPKRRIVEDLKIRNKDNMRGIAGEYFGSKFTYAQTFKMFEDYKTGKLKLFNVFDDVGFRLDVEEIMKQKYDKKQFLYKLDCTAWFHFGSKIEWELFYYRSPIIINAEEIKRIAESVKSNELFSEIKQDENWMDKVREWSLKGAEWGDKITWGYLWNACELWAKENTPYSYNSAEFNKAVADKLREIIVKTQVVDSTLTRSQMMRGKSAMVQTLTAFMSESTMTYNMVSDAFFEWSLDARKEGHSYKTTFSKHGRKFATTASVYALTAFATALAGDGVDFVGFEEIADMYSNTKAGKLANAYAGLCCAQLDSFEVAAQYLAKFKGNDEMASPAILGALANCYAQMEDLNQAAATFEKAAKVADNALLSPYYLFQAALVYESLENPAKALKLYNSIKFDYPNSKEAQTIEQYITRISSK